MLVKKLLVPLAISVFGHAFFMPGLLGTSSSSEESVLYHQCCVWPVLASVRRWCKHGGMDGVCACRRNYSVCAFHRFSRHPLSSTRPTLLEAICPFASAPLGPYSTGTQDWLTPLPRLDNDRVYNTYFLVLVDHLLCHIYGLEATFCLSRLSSMVFPKWFLILGPFSIEANWGFKATNFFYFLVSIRPYLITRKLGGGDG